MADAREKFAKLIDALRIGTREPSLVAFREKMMEAYGFDEPTYGITAEDYVDPEDNDDSALLKTAKMEKEFAQRCLDGLGPTQQEVIVDGDLRAVLLREIGLNHEPGKVVHPWLMGDWVKMAELIIHFADKDIEGNQSSRTTTKADQIIRIWPIERWATQIEDLGGVNRIECEIQDFPQPIFLQAKGKRYKRYKWLMLPEGPGRITSTTRENGLPRNMWTGTILPPDEVRRQVVDD